MHGPLNVRFCFHSTTHFTLILEYHFGTRVEMYDILLLLTRKAIPVQPCAGSEGSRSLRAPDYKTIGA